jgi:Amt family ammonium transporter
MSALPASSALLAFVLLLIAPLTIAGVAFLNTGLGRARSAAQALVGSIALAALAAILFVAFGSALATGPGLAFHLAGKPWNLFGSGVFFACGLASQPIEAQLGLLFELFAVALTVLLPWGSGADRLRLAAGACIAALYALVLFPLAAHWSWDTGWMAALGTNFGLGAGFIDPGGSGSIHVLGGFGALAVVWITGPRHGKFPKEGLSTAMPGHNVVYVLFGCLVSLVGWMAWNAAGALLWLHAPLTQLPQTVLNTVLSATAALAVTFTVTNIRFGKPDASLSANGWMAGLVASSASAAVIAPIAALFVGIIAGLVTPLLVELFELALSVDDPSGAIAVHMVAGLWGLLAAGLFSGGPGQLLAQLIGIAVLLGFFLPLVYFLLLGLNRLVPFRADYDSERIGMDLSELGGNAYPEFVMHRDDSYR